jgi:hypothetical protein
MVSIPSSRWFALAGAVLVAWITYAALMPVDWQIRLGLHWLIEHFLVFFTVTTLFCIAWPRPMAVAALLLPFAILIETAQGLTPDRVADPATALFAAAGVASAALLADLIIALRKRARKDTGSAG